jgi:large subunit ribosomal protein L35
MKKRVKVTGTGKYMRRRSHRSHYKLAKSSGTWKRLKRDVETSSGDSKKIRKLLG